MVPIMLALCLMLLATYYAQDYAGIIGWSLTTSCSVFLEATNDALYFKLTYISTEKFILARGTATANSQLLEYYAMLQCLAICTYNKM